MEPKPIRDLIISNRSCRRFDQSHRIDTETLTGLVDLARLSASAANLQPLKYYLSSDEEMNRKINDCLAWAAYLKDWDGPAEGERPAAFIVMLGDRAITTNFRCDHGIAAQSILLGAREKGLGGCMIAAIRQKQLRSLLDIPEELEILLVIALGKPAEAVTIDSLDPGGDIRYWRDEAGMHHVPKRGLSEIILKTWP